MPSGIKPSSKTDAQIIALYQSGLSAERVAAQVGLTQAGILGALSRLGIPRRPPRCKDNTTLPDSVRDNIVSVYVSGKNTYETAKIIGVSQKSVCKTLVMRGVPFRSLESTNRNLGVNHDFFDDINTDAKAWVLGFMSADGWVVPERNRIGVQVAEKDEEIIDKIQSFVCPGVVKKKTTKKVGSIIGVPYDRSFTNTILVWSSLQQRTALNKLGIVPRKTYSLTPWNGPNHLLPAYYRGIIDGDGCWSTAGLAISGTREIVDGFLNFVNRYITTKATPSRLNGAHGWKVSVGGATQWKTMASVLYKDATIWLARKREIAERGMQKRIRWHDRPRSQVLVDETLKQNSRTRRVGQVEDRYVRVERVPIGAVDRRVPGRPRQREVFGQKHDRVIGCARAVRLESQDAIGHEKDRRQLAHVDGDRVSLIGRGCWNRNGNLNPFGPGRCRRDARDGGSAARRRVRNG